MPPPPAIGDAQDGARRTQPVPDFGATVPVKANFQPMPASDQRIAEFRRLHESGCFVIPNPWDVGSALVLEQLGFSALATTSAGFAWSLGRRDNGVTLDEALAHFAAVAAAVKVPVNADFERAFATEPDEVGEWRIELVGIGVGGAQEHAASLPNRRRRDLLTPINIPAAAGF